MASKVYTRGAATPEMNITPLIDVTFLLIIFFMLVSNILSEETVEMFVPALHDPRTQTMTDGERVVVNIKPEPFIASQREASPLLIAGRARGVRVGLQDFTMDEMAGVTAALRDARQRNPDVEVLVRADAALHYDEVQPVMIAITEAGIATVNLVAYMPGVQDQQQP